MGFLEYLFKKILKISFLESLLFVIPLWLMVIFFINESFVERIKNPYLIYKTPEQFSFRKELFHHYLHSEYKRLVNTLNAKTIYTDKKIPVINLYFESHKLNQLFSNLPTSGKNRFIEGKLITGNAEVRVRAKLRGGSYWHWKNNHKSWRLKVLDGKKVFDLSSFDLVNPKLLFSISETLVQSFSRRLNLWNVENRLVRVNINNKYVGHSYSLSRLDVDFLRKNKMVSGSIYGIDTDSELVKDDNFYTTAKAWNTGVGWLDLTQLNHSLHRKKELVELGKVLRDKNLESFYNFFQKHFNKEKMYKYMALDSILGIYHHSNSTSQRYYFNNKEGLFSPIPWDHLHWIHFNYVMISRNPIIDKIRLHPKLNYEYLDVLWKTMNKDLSNSFIKKEIDDVYSKSYDAILDDPNKDAIGVNNFLVINPTATFSYDMSDYEKSITFNKVKIDIRHKFLNQYFRNIDLELSLDYRNNYNLLVVKNKGAISPRLVNFSKNNIYIDSNNNKIFDKKDMLFKAEEENLLYSVNGPSKHTIGDEYNLLHALIGKKTILKKDSNYLFFIPGKKIHSLDLHYRNPFTGKEFRKSAIKKKIKLNEVKFKEYSKYPSTRINNKILDIGPGIVEFKNTKVFNENVIISKNTKIKLGVGVSLIFKGKVVANGTRKEPISVFSNVENDLFGSFVIEGKNSSNSILKNIIFKNGNRSRYLLSEYSGMLNIYKSSNVIIEDVIMESFCENCNGMNIYKSENFLLKNIHIKNISNSLLNIQLSSGVVMDSNFESTLNNAVSLEFSQLKLKRTKVSKFFNAGIDKYKSKLILTDVIFKNGNVGLKSDVNNEKFIFKSDSINKEYLYD